MAQRELRTIGDLRGGRMARRYAVMAGRSIGAIGQTESTYVPPTLAQLDATPPGDALSQATVAMLNHFRSSGVPSEHTRDAFVLAFQEAYNKDALRAATGSPVDLAEDGGYGPNTHDTADVVADYSGGGPVPAVNSGAAPVVAPATTPTTPKAPAAHGASAWPWILGLGGAGIILWMVMRKKRRGRRRAAAPMLTIRTNPRHAGLG